MLSINYPLSLLFALLFFAAACNEDQSADEKAYFEDYESPDVYWGYIDRENRPIIRALYDDCRDFSEGLAAANLQGKWGYIDQAGKFQIAAAYRAAYGFQDGIARVQNFDKTYDYINNSGEKLNRLSFANAYDFRAGMARVVTDTGSYFINKRFEKFNNITYNKAYDFKDGYAIIKDHSGYGVIDTLGQVKLNTEYDRIRLFWHFATAKKNNVSIVYDLDNDKVLYTTPNVIIDYQNEWVSEKLNDGYQLRQIQTKKSFQFDVDALIAANNQLWIAQKGQKSFLIKENGERVNDKSYDLIQKYQDNRAACMVNDRWTYLDTEGRELFSPRLPLAFDFQNGLARMIVSGRIGMIDTSGNVVIPSSYIEIKDFHEGLARYQEYR